MYPEPTIHEDELVSFKGYTWNHLCRRCLVVFPEEEAYETSVSDCCFEDCTLLALGPVTFHGLYVWDATFRVAPGSAGVFTFSNVHPAYQDGITLPYESAATVSSFVEHAWWQSYGEQLRACRCREELERVYTNIDALSEVGAMMRQQDVWRWEDAAGALCARLGEEARRRLVRCLRPYLIDPEFLSFCGDLLMEKDEAHELG